MHVTRFYTTDGGGSAFDEFDFPVSREAPDAWGNALKFSEPFACPRVCVYEAPIDAYQSWHNAPARQLCAMMRGIWEVGTTDGETRRWGPGEVFMPDTVEGKGHTSRVIEGPVQMFFLPLPDDMYDTILTLIGTQV